MYYSYQPVGFNAKHLPVQARDCVLGLSWLPRGESSEKNNSNKRGESLVDGRMNNLIVAVLWFALSFAGREGGRVGGIGGGNSMRGYAAAKAPAIVAVASRATAGQSAYPAPARCSLRKFGPRRRQVQLVAVPLPNGNTAAPGCRRNGPELIALSRKMHKTNCRTPFCLFYSYAELHLAQGRFFLLLFFAGKKTLEDTAKHLQGMRSKILNDEVWNKGTKSAQKIWTSLGHGYHPGHLVILLLCAFQFHANISSGLPLDINSLLENLSTVCLEIR